MPRAKKATPKRNQPTRKTTRKPKAKPATVARAVPSVSDDRRLALFEEAGRWLAAPGGEPLGRRMVVFLFGRSVARAASKGEAWILPEVFLDALPDKEAARAIGRHAEWLIQERGAGDALPATGDPLQAADALEAAASLLSREVRPGGHIVPPAWAGGRWCLVDAGAADELCQKSGILRHAVKQPDGSRLCFVRPASVMAAAGRITCGVPGVLWQTAFSVEVIRELGRAVPLLDGLDAAQAASGIRGAVAACRDAVTRQPEPGAKASTGRRGITASSARRAVESTCGTVPGVGKLLTNAQGSPAFIGKHQGMTENRRRRKMAFFDPAELARFVLRHADKQKGKADTGRAWSAVAELRNHEEGAQGSKLKSLFDQAAQTII